MPPRPSISGFTRDGDFVKTIQLSHPPFSASILTFGARLLDLRLDDRPLTLSFQSLSAVEADSAYVGVAVGRTANRIRGGQLRLSDIDPAVELQRNENGRNHTHGGRRAWDKRLFAVREQSKDVVELFMYSPDGDQGYPSSVEVVVKYQLTERGLDVLLQTHNVGTQHTVTNMTVRQIFPPLKLSSNLYPRPQLHPYFDLTGRGGTVENSVLSYIVHASTSTKYLALDEHNVPTGETVPVENTRFDFCTFARKLALEDPFLGYDQFFVSSDTSQLDGPIRSMITICAPGGEYGPGLEMQVHSNQPGFQMYTANGFTSADPFARFGSVAVEPSGYIDACNNKGFPSISLGPGERRRQRISYHFRWM